MRIIMSLTRTSIFVRGASTAGVTALLLLAGGNAAQAADAGTNAECSGDGPDITIASVSDTYVPGDLRIYGDSGAVLSIEAGQTSAVSADVSVSGTLTADAVVASASVTAGVTLGVSQTITQSASASYTVPDGLNAQYIELGSAGVLVDSYHLQPGLCRDRDPEWQQRRADRQRLRHQELVIDTEQAQFRRGQH
jgi:hypothetical protein